MSFAWLDALVSSLPDPRLTWGLVFRGIGLLLMVSLGTLIPQVLPLSGKRGASPVARRLQRMREDFPGPGRFLRVPTLLWINASDAAIVALPVLGVLASALVIYGGETAKPALFFAWLCLLSLDSVAALYFPWDCMLLEVSILALFLPNVETLPGLAATSVPFPIVAFAFRVLVIRLMLGFAKVKFVGTKPNDKLYLKGFLAWAPLPTPLGWWAQHAPNWALRASLWFMFFAEVAAPLLAWFTGPARLVGFACLAALMMGIQLTGNWGYFNIGYVVVCLCLLDINSSVLDMGNVEWAAMSSSPTYIAVNAIIGLLLFVQLVQFAFNSWCTSSWMYWNFDDITTSRPWLKALINFFRFLQPLRLVHAYGVFPPNSSPPIKIVPMFEGSDDGVHWESYRLRFVPTTADEAPPLVAPYHPRIDQTFVYSAAGLTESNSMGSLVGNGRPYGWAYYAHTSYLDRCVQRLLEADPMHLRLYSYDPFHGRAPKQVRVSLMALTPCSIAEHRATGNYWRVRRCGLLIPPQKLDPQVWEDALPPPELFHTDHVDDKRRAPALRTMLSEVARGVEVDRAVCAASDLTADEVDVFWRDVVPNLNARPDDTVGKLFERAEALRERFGDARPRRFERLLERFSLILREKAAPYAYGSATPHIPKMSHYRLSLLINTTVLDGRDAYYAALENPSVLAERAGEVSLTALIRGQIFFRSRMVDFIIRAQRVSLKVLRRPEIPLPGVWEFFDLLLEYKPEGELWLPTWSLTDDGDFVIEGFGAEKDLDDSSPSMAAS